MANFFSNLLKKAIPSDWEYRLGITPRPKTMTFRVGEGLNEEQKKKAQETIKRTAETAPPPRTNFFVDIVRDVPRSIMQLGLKYTGKEEEYYPGIGFPLEGGKKVSGPGLPSAVEKFIFGEEPIQKPKGVFQTGLAIVGSLPMFPGKKKAAETVIKKGGEKILEKEVGVKALKISEQAAKKIINTVKEIKPELEAIKGSTLTHTEVTEAAKTSNILRRVVTRDETLKREATLLRTKQQLAALAEGKGIKEEFVNTLKVVKSEATNLGRQLEALKVEAGPELVTTKTQIIGKLIELGHNTEDIIKKANNIDFNNAGQVAKFYRQFVKPSIGEAIDEYRYINLLSSPRTQIVNAFSNLLQAAVLEPTTKLATGGLDLIKSGLTGKARQSYISEVPAYYKGMFNAIGDATSEAFKVLKGQQQIYRPDVSRIPTKLKVLAPFQIVPRLMEATDVYFRTLIMEGEKEALALRAIKKGTKITESLISTIEKEAREKAEYFVFRQPIGAETSYLLKRVDKMTSAIYSLRNVPGVKWFIPFVTTPMNILKQGIEYSPAGFVTIPGAVNKTEQLAKALIGSMVFSTAGYIAMKGDSTWAPPTDPKEKSYFYTSGKQPYSLRIGDYWINYSRLGPLAYPIAMAAATKHYTQQNPDRITDDTFAKTTKILSGIGGFFSDQSYVQGIGNIIDTLRGDEYAVSQTLGNLPTQLIPVSSFQRWINSYWLDPIYRKTKPGISLEGMIQDIQASILGMSKGLPAYTQPFGEQSKRDMPLSNVLSPLGISIEKKDYTELYNLLMEKREASAEIRKIKEELRKELGL